MTRFILSTLITFGAVSAKANFMDGIYNNSEQMYFWGALGAGSTGAYLINDEDTLALPISGLVGIGADFEYMLAYDFGLAATLRSYTMSEEIESTEEEYSLSIFSLGVSARFHYPVKFWNFYFGPGLSFTSASAEYDAGDQEADSGLGLAPTITMGVMIYATDSMSFGVENQRIYGLGEKLQGEIISDYMLKGRFAL